MKLKFALALALTTATAAPVLAGSIADKAAVCAACHGDNGTPVKEDVPILWGQNEGYIYIELKDFKSGLRASDQMGPIAAGLSKDDMKALAAYFTKKPWPNTGYQSSEADIKAGQRIATAGMCTECHLGNFTGNSVIPRNAGQTVTYLEKTLLDFKSRARANNPDKSTLLGSFSEDDLKAMARYLAGMHPQQ